MSVEVKGATLMKRSRNRSVLSVGINWQLRRISLTETKITYGLVDGPPKDFVPINNHTTCEKWEGEDKEHAFRIETGKDELILCATSPQDREEWIEAVRKVANPPPPPSTGDPVADAAAAEAHAKALEAQRAADQKAIEAKESASSMMPSMGSVTHAAERSVTGGVASGLVGGLMGAAEREAEGAAAKAAAGLLDSKKAEEEARAKAEAEAKRQQMLAKIRVPVSVEKKLNHESSYHPRWIWVDTNEKKFHWAKSNDASKSKNVHIPTHVKSVTSSGEVGMHNFSVELKDHESIFSSVFGTVPTHLEVKMEDAEMNKAFIEHIKELMK